MAVGPRFLCFLEQSGPEPLSSQPPAPSIVPRDGFQMPRSHEVWGPGQESRPALPQHPAPPPPPAPLKEMGSLSPEALVWFCLAASLSCIQTNCWGEEPLGSFPALFPTSCVAWASYLPSLCLFIGCRMGLEGTGRWKRQYLIHAPTLTDCYQTHLQQRFPKWVPDPQSASPGNGLEMRILRPSPRPVDSKALRMGSGRDDRPPGGSDAAEE